MNKRVQLIVERANLIPNFIVCSSILISLNLLLQEGIKWKASLLGFITILTFVIELRLMDEYKDYEKDKIANKTRPLPRGLISLDECLQMIYGFLFALFVFAALAFVYFGPTAGICLLIVNVWLYLMYKEFFVGSELANYPLIYAITHQIIIIPLLFFLTALMNPALIFSSTSIGFALVLLGSFFTYEVGRKLNPAADKILKTYLVMYGEVKTATILAVLLLIPLYGAYLMHLFLWELIPTLLLYAHLPLIKIKPDYFKKIEGLIGLFLIYNMIYPAIAHLFK